MNKPKSNSNPVLRQLRETADILGKPQSVVARNWLKAPAMTTYKSGVGVTRGQFNHGQMIIRRIAA